ncbi:hypothetical protein RMCBS344292_00787 [Rhizopus microsporus]|nr:hypothetical protein RMCBS344292_00787 [Rhizopus microsporus]
MTNILKELIQKQRDLLAFLEDIDSNLEEEGLSVEDIEDALVGLSSQQDNFMNNVYDVFEAAGLAEEEEIFFDCEDDEEEDKQFTVEEYETEEIRRDIAMMARLQEQRRAYFEEGIIPEDSLGRAYVLDYYDASTSADLVETESELSCEEESRGSKRKADEDEEDEDEDEEQVRASKRLHL